jgi:SAM-dependent methyltransferase
MKRLDKCLKIASNYSARSVIDIGGDDGTFVRKLASVLGSSIWYNFDRKNGDILGINNIPFFEHEIDFIFAGNMVDILPDPDFLLKEIARLLPPTGLALLTFPSLDWWANKIAILLGFQPYGDRPSTEYNVGKLFIKPDKFSEKNAGYFHYFSRRAFKQLAEIYGFKVKFYSLPFQRYSICLLSLR